MGAKLSPVIVTVVAWETYKLEYGTRTPERTGASNVSAGRAAVPTMAAIVRARRSPVASLGTSLPTAWHESDVLVVHTVVVHKFPLPVNTPAEGERSSGPKFIPTIVRVARPDPGVLSAATDKVGASYVKTVVSESVPTIADTVNAAKF